MFLGSSLVNMYSKCGSIEGTWKVFQQDEQTQFGLLECQDSGICEVWTREKRALENAGRREGVQPTPVYLLWEFLNVCA
jgi:hypothetical protein